MNEPISGTICRILKTVFAFDSLIIEKGYKVFKFMLQPFEVEHKKRMLNEKYVTQASDAKRRGGYYLSGLHKRA